MLSGIRIAVFGAGCAELGAVIARPREVGVLSGPARGSLETAVAGGFWRGLGVTDAPAWRGGMDIPASALPLMADLSAATEPMAYALADEARHGVVPAAKPTVAPAARRGASVIAAAARDKSAFQTAAIAHTNKLQAKTQASTRRHPDSRGPSQTEPPV